VDQLSASLSKRLAANTALLECGTVPDDLDALLSVIDELSVSGVIGVNNGLTPVACMRAATLALSVHAFLLRPDLPMQFHPILPPIDSLRPYSSCSCKVTITTVTRARTSRTTWVILSDARCTP
jgi:hypothetical protein